MVAAFVLIVGVLLVMGLASIVFVTVGCAEMLGWMVPWAPLLVMIGSFFLMLTELLLLVGGKEDRRAALRDFGYLLPAFFVSAALWFLAQYYLW